MKKLEYVHYKNILFSKLKNKNQFTDDKIYIYNICKISIIPILRYK